MAKKTKSICIFLGIALTLTFLVCVFPASAQAGPIIIRDWSQNTAGDKLDGQTGAGAIWGWYGGGSNSTVLMSQMPETTQHRRAAPICSSFQLWEMEPAHNSLRQYPCRTTRLTGRNISTAGSAFNLMDSGSLRARTLHGT